MDAEQLGGTMMERLAELFEEEADMPGPRPVRSTLQRRLAGAAA